MLFIPFIFIIDVPGFYCSVVGTALPPSPSVAMERELKKKTPFDRTLTPPLALSHTTP